MKYENVVEGMKVRVSANIEKTHRKFDSSQEMQKMKGEICEVRRLTSRNGVRVRGDNGTWTFTAEDLSPLTLHKKPKAVTFDPKNL